MLALKRRSSRDTGRDFDCSQRCKSVAHVSDWRIAVGLASDASATACVRRRCQVYLSYLFNVWRLASGSRGSLPADLALGRFFFTTPAHPLSHTEEPAYANHSIERDNR